jgi:sigma-B regulation protein RsbQ
VLARSPADETEGTVLATQRHNVRISGAPDGPPMVFAHGFGCDQSMWRRVAPSFDPSHQVVLFDWVGAGGSDLGAFRPSRYASLTGYARDLLELIDELDLDDVVFVGHSVSAMIGVLAANQAPERFRSLVLVGPSPRYLDDEGYVGGFQPADIDELLANMDRDYLGWSSVMGPLIMGNADRPELAGELTEAFCRTDADIAKHFARVTFLSDNRADLPRVQVPSLILQCRDDAIASMDVGRYVDARLPDSRFVVLDAVGHCPHVSAPGEMIAAMRAFV